MRTHWLVCLFGLVGAVGCAVEEVNEQEQALEPQTPCPPFRCTNSPELILYNMHELNLVGLQNAQSVTLEQHPFGRAALYKGNQRYAVYFAAGGIMYGVSELGQVIAGQALVGAELRLRVSGYPLYNIKINRYREITYPIGPSDKLAVYQFSWYLPGFTWIQGKDICNGANSWRNTKVDLQELYSMNADETLLFTGDRFDPATLTIAADPTNNWLNFGCASFTLAKLHLSRHTSSSSITPVPNPDMNQAMLKMYTGDYCNLGEPITVSGRPMIWANKTTGFLGTPTTLEARWTKNGAACVNQMRLEANPSSAYPFPPRARLNQLCPQMPACADTNPYSFGNDPAHPEQATELVSANPIL